MILSKRKTPERGPWHEAGSLRMLPSGPDLVQIAHSMASPVKRKF